MGTPFALQAALKSALVPVRMNDMTLNDVRKVLLENAARPMEVRTTDGRRLVVLSKEHWARWADTLILVSETRDHNEYVAARNIASIAPARRGRRRPTRPR